jgi:hypothetical protein
MNDNELKSLWHEQEWQPPTPLSDAELLIRMHARMRRFDRTIFWRDIRELAACAFILVFFGRSLFQSASTLTHAGAALLVAASIWIALALMIARRRHKPLPPSVPMSEFVAAERTKVDRQRSLLQSVLWWYILPIYIGVALFILGSGADVTFKITFMVTYAGVCVFIYFLNQHAVRKSLAPLQNELNHLLQSFPNPTEFPPPNQEN